MVAPYEASQAYDGVTDSSTGANGTPVASWDERLDEVQRLYPTTADDSWFDALGDVETMGAILRDALRVGHTPKRRGSRPALDVDDGEERLRQLFGEDYTTLPFDQAFKALAGNRSVSVLSAKTGLSRSHIQRLMAGRAPKGSEMETVARAFNKPPVYFVEYRNGLLLAAVLAHLSSAPEASVGLVRRLGMPGKARA